MSLIIHNNYGQINHIEKSVVNINPNGTMTAIPSQEGKAEEISPTDEYINQDEGQFKPEEEFFKYIHYDIDDDKERLHVHKAICRIVKLPKMQQVIDALKELMDDKRLLRTIKQDAMLAELRRLGLPDGSTTGFSDNNFFSAYKHIVG